ncbi:MAG: hypothetical protein P9X24_16165 [Candidatus Hatepunaea meridiana]|nr:hypothetical protein [Candidatus Hatepunaea meridiana]
MPSIIENIASAKPVKGLETMPSKIWNNITHLLPIKPARKKAHYLYPSNQKKGSFITK